MTSQLLLKMEHYGSGANNMLQLIFAQFYKYFCSHISTQIQKYIQYKDWLVYTKNKNIYQNERKTHLSRTNNDPKLKHFTLDMINEVTKED